MFKYSHMIPVFAVAFGGLSLQEAQAQTLGEELSSLMNDHPRIQAAREVDAVAAEEINMAYAAFYPTVNLAGDAGYEHVNSPTRRSGNNPWDPSYNRGRETATLTITQNLYNGGRNLSEVHAAEIGKEAAVNYVNEQAQKALKEGIQAYLLVLQYAQNLKHSQDNVENIRSQYDLEDERVRLGGGVSLDVLESKKRLLSARFRMVEMEGSLEIVSAQYKKMFGHAPDISAMTLPAMFPALVPETVDECIELAMKNNPTLRKLLNLMHTAEEQKFVEESAYMPTLNLVFEQNYEKDKNTTIGIRRDWSVLLKANWELFSGFKSEAGIAQAAHNYEATKNDLFDNKRTIAELATKAWETMQYNRKGIDLYQSNVNISQEVFEGRKRQREAGKETLIQVLDAELTLFEAKLILTETKYKYMLAVYDLFFAMGMLTPDIGDIASNQPGALDLPAMDSISPLASPSGAIDTLDLNSPEAQ